MLTTAWMQTLRGTGNCTTITWAGATSTDKIFVEPDCASCNIENLYVNVTTTAAAAFQTENSGTGSFTPTQDTFRGITVQGTGNVTDCFLLDGPVDANNDQQRFVDDHCYGYVQSGWHLGNSSTGFNILNVVIDHSTCVGGGGQYCVYQQHGSFAWYDGDMGSNSVSDFYIGSPSAGGYTIHDVESESSSMFLQTAIGLGNAAHVEVSGITWADNCLGVTTPATIAAGCPGTAGTLSGNAILFGYGGALHVRDSYFGGFHNALTMDCVAGQVGTYSPYMGCEFENNTYVTSATTVAAIFPANVDKSINSSYLDSSSVEHLLPDTINSPTTFNNLVTFNTSPFVPSPATQTYTPALQFGGASTGITYSTDSGAYWVENGFTTARITLVLAGVGSAAGAATITLPGTSTNGGFGNCIVTGNGTGLAPLTPMILAGTSYITLYTQAATQANTLTNSNFSNATSMFCYMRYN